MPSQDEYLTVTQLNTYVKSYLEGNYFLTDFYVKGEISNFKRHQSGTFYFAIKDEKCAVNVVMFPGYASRVKVSLKDGDLVLIRGRISVYEVRGTYSIQATEIIFDSKGMLLIQYEELKRKLKEEGLFDESHKKELPSYPKRIGLITAPYGAAVQDMQRTIKNRWPIADIYVFPCLVQGADAKYDIVKKISEADNYHLDVIICGRGGGSIEDLWPFNEEIVARAFYECKTPIISAVGHEIDTVISDYVADARGLTPTDGAMKATPDKKKVLEQIDQLKKILTNNMLSYLEIQKQNVSKLKSSYVLSNPAKIYENYRLMIDELETSLVSKMSDLSKKEEITINDLNHRLNNAITVYANNKKQELIKLTSKLDSLSPLKVLNRGYGFVTVEGKIVNSVKNIKENDEIKLSLSDGNVKAKVISKESK